MENMQRAWLSFQGLSIGDAFGEETLKHPDALESRWLSRAMPWRWSDDTAQALAVVEVLSARGAVDADALAERLSARYMADPRRGYGMATRRLLRSLAEGGDWREVAPALFDGGSYGNGGAMRAPPIGAFYAGQPEQAAAAGALAASVTHAHPEGRAGGQAVAVAASLVGGAAPVAGAALLDAVASFLPASEVRRRILLARDVASDALSEAVSVLGNGQQISAQDTVPLCLWVAAHHLGTFEPALWWTAQARGDADTCCAIVGGILALRAPLPIDWLDAREPLPRDAPPEADQVLGRRI